MEPKQNIIILYYIMYYARGAFTMRGCEIDENRIVNARSLRAYWFIVVINGYTNSQVLKCPYCYIQSFPYNRYKLVMYSRTTDICVLRTCDLLYWDLTSRHNNMCSTQLYKIQGDDCMDKIWDLTILTILFIF